MAAEGNEGRLSSESNFFRTTYSPGRREFEILEAYNALVDAGGRPVCRLDEIAKVSQSASGSWEGLRAWLGELRENEQIDWRDVFLRQLSNWKLFKTWQKDNRSTGQTSANPSAASGLRCSEQRLTCTPDRSTYIFTTESNFRMHVESSRRRLQLHGFTKEFNFDINAASQDRWTTWVEYLSFESFCQDRTLRLGRANSVYEEQPRSVRSLGVDFQRLRTRSAYHSCESANHAAETARIDVVSTLHETVAFHEVWDESGRPINKVDAIGLATTHALRDDQEQLQEASPPRGRNEFGEFEDDDQMQSGGLHGLILQWALSQENAIATEVVERNLAGGASPTSSSARGTKRTRVDGIACVGSCLCSNQRQGIDSSCGIERDAEQKRLRSDG